MRDIVKTFDNDTKYRNDFQELENEQEFANKSARLMRKRVNQLKERLLRGKPSKHDGYHLHREGHNKGY